MNTLQEAINYFDAFYGGVDRSGSAAEAWKIVKDALAEKRRGTCEVCGEPAAVSLCYNHFTQRLKDEQEHPF